MKRQLLFSSYKYPPLMSFILLLLTIFSQGVAATPVLGFLLPESDSIRQKRASTIIYNNNGSSTELSYNGKITFTDDERDIKSISPGGFFRYSKTTFGNRREINIQSTPEGTLTRRYYVGRVEQPYEPDGRQWLQEMLPEVIATCGIGAEDRVERLYTKSGLNGVLKEIGKIESDHVQSIYFTYLLKQPNLKDQDLRLVLTQINRFIDSDYTKGGLLRKIGPTYLQHDKTTEQYLAAVTTMSSDYEKTKVISYLLQNGKLSPGNYTQLLNTTSRITSDYEQAKVLRQVVASPSFGPKVYKQAIGQVATITSDYEKAKVLSVMINNESLVAQNFDELLVAIRNIRSDYEKSRMLSNLATKHKFSTQNYLQVFPVVADINSTYEKSKTLQRLRTNMPLDNNQVRAAYMRTAKTISSDYEYRRVVNGLD